MDIRNAIKEEIDGWFCVINVNIVNIVINCFN